LEAFQSEGTTPDSRDICKLITDEPIPKANAMNDQLRSVFSNAEKITESEFKSN
jgi:hypothetical protein